MPRLDDDFSPTEPGAIGDYTIDFTGNVPAGGISSAVWSLAVRYVAPGYPIDPAPASRLSGAVTVAGVATVQRIAGLYAGNTYLVTATATMEDGEIVILWCTLSCVAPA